MAVIHGVIQMELLMKTVLALELERVISGPIHMCVRHEHMQIQNVTVNIQN